MIKGSASRRAAVVRRITGGCGRPPANSWTIGWWCYFAAAYLLAMVIVDNSPWGYAVGETYFAGV